MGLFAQTWNTIDTGFPDADFDCLQMIDGNTVYAAGYNNIASNTLIIKSTNGGNTWANVSPFSDAGYVASIAFSDVDNGFITLSSGRIYMTNNGGDDWTQMLAEEDGNIFVVEYAENNVFYALHSAGKLYKTVDMGANWTIDYDYGSNVFLNTILSSGKAMAFSSENFAMFGYNNDPGELYVYDEEDMYSTYSSSHSSGFEAVCAINDDLFFASSGARFVRVSDPGSDYQITNNLTNALYINSLDFFDSNHGFGTTSTGRIYLLTNLGASYTTEIEDLSELRDISIGDNQTVMACGHGAAIYKRSGTINASNALVDKNPNLSLYPIPAQNQITVNFDENINNVGEFKIFNSIGQCVKVGDIKNSEKKINTSDLENGVYSFVYKGANYQFIIVR